MRQHNGGVFLKHSGMRSAIDIHAHFMGSNVVTRLKSEYGRYGVTAYEQDGRPVLKFPTHSSRPALPGITDLKARISWMRSKGVGKQILSSWIDLYGYDLAEDKLVEFSRMVNEEASTDVSGYPGYFGLLATLPLPYGKRAAEELEYFVLEKGFLGAIIGTSILSRNLDEDFMEPLWTESEKLGVPILLHPESPSFGERLGKYYLKNLLGNPLDTAIAASSIVLGGVLDKHPGLKIILSHGGGYFPYGIGRLNHGYNVRNETRINETGVPASYLKRFFYDTVIYDRHALTYLLSMDLGANLAVGSDYPFDMQPSEPLDILSGLDNETYNAITKDNAENLFYQQNIGHSPLE